MSITPKAHRLTDAQIRNALVAKLQSQDASAAIFHELPLLRGERRADIVHVNGTVAAYEIKSECDSLARLKAQAAAYNTVCEFMTVVTAGRHLEAVRRTLPKAWGITIATGFAETLQLIDVRRARKNTQLSKPALIRLLWKDECLKVLKNRGIEVKRNAPVVDVWMLLEQLPTKVLFESVRSSLKARHHFESDHK